MWREAVGEEPHPRRELREGNRRRIKMMGTATGSPSIASSTADREGGAGGFANLPQAEEPDRVTGEELFGPVRALGCRRMKSPSGDRSPDAEDHALTYFSKENPTAVATSHSPRAARRTSGPRLGLPYAADGMREPRRCMPDPGRGAAPARIQAQAVPEHILRALDLSHLCLLPRGSDDEQLRSQSRRAVRA